LKKFKPKSKKYNSEANLIENKPCIQLTSTNSQETNLETVKKINEKETNFGQPELSSNLERKIENDKIYNKNINNLISIGEFIEPISPISYSSSQQSLKSSSKRSKTIQYLDEDVNTFELPLRELVHKIPRNEPFFKPESKNENHQSENDLNNSIKSEYNPIKKESNGPQLKVDADGNLVLDEER
ncbi:MAG: hypothetical protein MHPSP_000599, partial [Paramarteilia canceri]